MSAGAEAPHDVVIAVPCYNEQARLPADEFVRFAREHRDVGFVFVDDGSTDATARLLRALCARAPESFRVLEIERSGKAEAVRRGVADALARGGRFVGYWDADLSTPLDAIHDFIGVFESRPELALVMGARVQLLGRSIRRSAFRHYLGRVFATAASLVLDLAVYDTQCGAKLFRVGDLTRRVFDERFESKWTFDVEIIARLKRHARLSGGTDIERLVHEYPLKQWHDVGGSKRRLHHYFVAARDLLVVLARYDR
jgi:dolichyl-phosphate beta-glucosyltransferase